MRNDLLSIGEVSKLKGVGVKALRYYERIGILLPAFVDEQTGYRYYDLRQMSEIDVIVACIELGIPLKELNAYRSDRGVLDIATLLEHGRALAAERLRKAQASLLQVDAYRDEIALQRKCRDAEAPYMRRMEQRSLLALPWEGETFDARRYVRGMTALYEQARLRGLVPLYVVGMARVPYPDAGEGFVGGECEGRGGRDCGGRVECKDERACAWNVVLEVQALPDAEPPADLLTLPGGEYRGARIVGGSFEECFDAVFAATASPDVPGDAVGEVRAVDAVGKAGVVLAHEIWDDELCTGRFVLEALSLCSPPSSPVAR